MMILMIMTVTIEMVIVKKIGKISVYKHSFCYSNAPTTANKALVGTLITIGDVNDIFPIITKIVMMMTMMMMMMMTMMKNCFIVSAPPF